MCPHVQILWRRGNRDRSYWYNSASNRINVTEETNGRLGFGRREEYHRLHWFCDVGEAMLDSLFDVDHGASRNVVIFIARLKPGMAPDHVVCLVFVVRLL